MAESTAANRGDERSFFYLVGAMFQGAFSDNLYRLALVMMVVGMARQEASTAEAANDLAASYQGVLGALFMLPYVLAVSLAGWLSDRFSKTSIVVWTKALEIVVMGLATLAFVFGEPLLGPIKGVWLSVPILFLMGLQSSLFSPARYGIVPELLPEHRLGWANGIMQGAIFLAIVLGTIAGPVLFDLFEGTPYLVGVVLMLCGAVGLVATKRIAVMPVANPAAAFVIDPVRPVWRGTRRLMEDVGTRWATFGIVVWWLVAMALQAAAVLMATNVLGLEPTGVGIALVPVVVAQGIGCFLASYFCSARIELGLVPFGAAGMFLTGVLAWWFMPGAEQVAMWRAEGVVPSIYLYGIPIAIALVGFTMGFFIVPLEAFINERTETGERGSIWATMNVLSALGTIVGAILTPAITALRSDPADVFLASGLMMALTGAVICVRFPRLPLRFMVLAFLRSRYRVVAQGMENVPRTGGALLAPNHQSYLDGILIAAALDRPVRFVMSQMVYRLWYVRPFAALTRSIPIEQNQSPRELISALRAAGEEIEKGGVVCIFPEGQLTRNGQMMPFRRGVERIMKDLRAPIIPVAIDGAYDTDWALRRGRRSGSRNGGWFHRGLVSVVFGKPLPSSTPPDELRRVVAELRLDAFAARRTDAVPLHRMAMQSLRSQPTALLYSDHNGEELVPNHRVLTAVVALGHRLAPLWKSEECIGLLLPPSIGSLAVNIAALLGGRVPVNLNYTTSPQIMAETCRSASIRLIITSRVFVEKAKLELPEGSTVVYLEDIRKELTGGEKLTAMIHALFLPIPALERSLGRAKPANLDDLATLIYSSGSTGTPKGVMLTHWNIISNIAGTLQYVECDGPSVRFLGALPFFHSFGYMSTLWLPLVRKVGVSFYPNPLDGKAIGAVVERYKVTHLFATPTFLSTYIRRVEPGQFGSLRFVLTGAEKLKDFVVTGFRERFGIEPIEGFGATECSPVVALNGQDYREPGIYQVGTKRGTVGQPIPAMCVRIVDLTTGEPVGSDQSGMLLVRGHSVMQGYYGQPEKTAEAFEQGWYRTGDIASLDEDGFLTIRDRLARFSKIGGEMVPHVRIEEALHLAIGTTEVAFGVTSVSDDKRGERIVVLYTVPEAKAREACDQLSRPEFNLPPLWIPKFADFVPIPEIPALGSGKMDLRAMKSFAAEAVTKRGG
ncbi:MFS transporter [bacterium]|nr:MFS transporter [bacterium]